MLQLDYLADWPLSGAREERRGTVLVSLTQDCCALTALTAGGRLRLVDRRHRQGWSVFSNWETSKGDIWGGIRKFLGRKLA